MTEHKEEGGNAEDGAQRSQTLNALRYLVEPEFRQRMKVTDSVGLFLIIRALEFALKDGAVVQEIFELFYTKEGATEIYRDSGTPLLKGTGELNTQIEIGRPAVLEFMRAKWSVMFAEDKLCFHQLGLISAKDGDLRKATLVSPQRLALKMLEWQHVRKNPFPEDLWRLVDRAIAKDDYKFLRKLSEVVKKPAQQFDPAPKTPLEKLQYFLLRNWVKEPLGAGGKPTPALCYFSDDGLHEYLYNVWSVLDYRQKNKEDLDQVKNLDSRSLRTVRERLGLIRVDHPPLRSAVLKHTPSTPTPATGKITIIVGDGRTDR